MNKLLCVSFSKKSLSSNSIYDIQCGSPILRRTDRIVGQPGAKPKKLSTVLTIPFHPAPLKW